MCGSVPKYTRALCLGSHSSALTWDLSTQYHCPLNWHTETQRALFPLHHICVLKGLVWYLGKGVKYWSTTLNTFVDEQVLPLSLWIITNYHHFSGWLKLGPWISHYVFVWYAYKWISLFDGYYGAFSDCPWKLCTVQTAVWGYITTTVCPETLCEPDVVSWDAWVWCGHGLKPHSQLVLSWLRSSRVHGQTGQWVLRDRALADNWGLLGHYSQGLCSVGRKSNEIEWNETLQCTGGIAQPKRHVTEFKECLCCTWMT